VIRHFFTLNLK